MLFRSFPKKLTLLCHKKCINTTKLDILACHTWSKDFGAHLFSLQQWVSSSWRMVFFFGRLPRALWCIQARAQDSRWGGPLCQFIPRRARNIFCTPPRFFWRLTWIDGAPEIWYHFIVITKHQSSWVKWDAKLLAVKLPYGSPYRSVVGRSVCHNFKFH